MSTYTQIIYQIVFGTRNRERTLTKEGRDELYKYITGLLKNKNCHLFRMGGVEDHVHILTDLHPTIALSGLVKDIKLASSQYIKSKRLFPHFNGWQVGFGAFTYSIREKDILIEYIKNQEAHHHKKSFKEEYMELLNEHEVEFEDKYLL